ncbi:hypothetical protein [Flavobacterium sp. 25HG05S-40]|uniref:hypothetical protein n=1 Tax=Flavobacterium sp. 25HG05S-40 TaxID=3458682 RepID=UPI004044416B
MKDFKLDNEAKISSGFTTPSDYFDSFPEKVLAQISQEEPKVISIFRSRRNWYFAAAAVVTLTLSIPVYNFYRLQSQEIDAATLENYIAYNSTISQEQIIDLLEQEDLDKIKLELNIDDAAIEDALQSNTNLEDYLID